MRRSQSTLLTTLAVVISLLFMAQFPTISPVSNVHPDDTNQQGPPTTDSDGDGIPDVHEDIFAEWVNSTAIDGRGYSMQGMDADDASDAILDVDRDGLNSTEEYCWPYPAECTDPGFLRGLTGVVDGEGFRSYLDPRKSDTDGDGMPDGYEAYMCLRIGGFDVFSQRYECTDFDPLNASDVAKDPDKDGFDVNRDGIMSFNEWYTSSEEYIYGAPSNHTTELDGLWCAATLPEGSILTNWPYIPTGVNATFQNILAACTNSESPVGEDLWLGTDPLLKDSDRYNWDGFNVRNLFPSFGDGIPDGWEVHFGLDPLNRSSALSDEDLDGWDKNLDGVISPDVSRTATALELGEQLSNIEEYNIYFDDGNTVMAGLKSTLYASEMSTLYQYPISFATQSEEISVINHDVRSLEVVDSMLYVTTKYGITVIDNSLSSSTDYWIPQGVELYDSTILRDQSDQVYAIALASNVGLGVARIQLDGLLQSVDNWDWSQTETIHELEELLINSPNNQIIGLGFAGTGNVFEVSSFGLIEQVHEVSQAITNQLSNGNASVTDIEHGLANGNLTLFVATDRGLLTCETNSGRDGNTADWRFFYSKEDTGVFASINELRTLPTGSAENPAEVRDILLDGPSPESPQVLWFGTPSGLHQMRLIDNVISHSGLLENPGSNEVSTRDINSIRSIYSTGQQIILGSNAGTWVLSGDYSNVYEIDQQETIPGYISEIATIGSLKT
ncbi:MAG: hypothetical protein L7T81_04795 [Candidatus Poseidoniaceae archaeon]|nr:hypothetical protein [Candidatus Poseidoniaceae archaeon]